MCVSRAAQLLILRLPYPPLVCRCGCAAIKETTRAPFGKTSRPKHKNATAVNPGTAPTLTIDGPNCTPVYGFQGNQFLNFNRPIAGLNQMTIVLVAKSDQRPPALYPSSNAAIFWQENARWGNTYLSPYAEYATDCFGTTQPNTDELYTRPVTIGGDYAITTSVHNGSTNTLYVNGKQVQQTHGLWALGGSSGAAVLGEGLNGTPFNGKIGEVLVWNRVLSDDRNGARGRLSESEVRNSLELAFE